MLHTINFCQIWSLNLSHPEPLTLGHKFDKKRLMFGFDLETGMLLDPNL